MMFNGLLVCGDSDGSDLTKESGAGSSLATTTSGSGGGTCDSARAQYYHDKLLATLKVLQNREETVRVQAESLAVAEQRIATLKVRNMQMRRELDQNAHELRALRKKSSVQACCPKKKDACVCTDTLKKDTNSEKEVVTTLETNLTVIEELYRECFYETAKQEELIENLRKSYLDVRLMDKEKTQQINNLQNVINSQKLSLERCQDVAMEVEELKVEISNFLNNSNNDSGVWETSLAVEVGEDLQDIMQQLHTLRELLQADCECGMKTENEKLKDKYAKLQATECCLKKENAKLKEVNAALQAECESKLKREKEKLKEKSAALQACECGSQKEIAKLKEANAALQRQVEEYQRRMCGLECGLDEKEETIGRFRRKIDETNSQITTIMSELQCLQQREQDRQNECECLQAKLQQVEDDLSKKTLELEQTRRENNTLEDTVKELREELEKADQIIKENCRVRSEVTYLSQQVTLWRRQLAESETRVRGFEAELQRARNHCRNIDTCYREKATAAAALQAQLEEAHARGAELCAEARRVVCAVRHWVRRMRTTNSELNEKIKQQQCTIDSLRKALEDKTNRRRDCRPDFRSQPSSSFEQSCTECLPLESPTETADDAVRERERSDCRCVSGERETASSSAESPSMLRRMLYEATGIGIMRCTIHERRGRPRVRPESSTSGQSCSRRNVQMTRTVSPTEELFNQVDRLQNAMTEGQKIWAKPKNPSR